MKKKFGFEDVYMMFFIPCLISLFTKLLDTWIFVLSFGIFGVLFLIAPIKERFAKVKREGQ